MRISKSCNMIHWLSMWNSDLERDSAASELLLELLFYRPFDPFFDLAINPYHVNDETSPVFQLKQI